MCNDATRLQPCLVIGHALSHDFGRTTAAGKYNLADIDLASMRFAGRVFSVT